MGQLFKNNASGLLSAGCTAAATSLVLVDASNMPTPAEGDYYLLTLIGLNENGQENAWEIVKVTAKAGNTLTVERGQEGTTAVPWGAATAIQLRITASTLDRLAEPPTKAAVGLGNVDNTSDANKPISTAAQAVLNNKAGGNAAYNIGYLNIPQNIQSAAYTCVLADAGKHILHPAADTTARTYTIPSNASVPYPIGTALTFVNQNGTGGIVTIAITTDTMRLAGAGTTGSRTLARNGIATALKITATEWIISGTGLT